ncbi:hypothetical protein IWW40_002972 [Coemansia sp. RSA 1250]|nr:hypothetical protein IWW40_002972 [Coemansia sp. RSA 1250]
MAPPDVEEEKQFSAEGSTSKKPEAEELDDDYGEVNMDELGSKVWLVKVPSFLAEKWKEPRENGIQLGKMRIYDRADSSGSNISIILNDTEEYKDIPKEYRMQVANEKVSNMFIFSEGRNPREIIKPTSTLANKHVPISMTGTVHHECTMTPRYTEEYTRIMRKRFLNRHKNSRKAQPLAKSEYSRSMLNVDNNMFDVAQKKSRVDSRMTRMDRQELMNMIFAGFERYPYWNFKGLVEHTRQPAAYLREVLQEVARLNKNGPYANYYSLKPQFRKASADAAAAAEAAKANASSSAGGTSNAEGQNSDEDLDMDDEDFEDV